MTYKPYKEQHEHPRKPKGYDPTPHTLSPKEEFYSNVSKKREKPDPATVEAELQQEEELWKS
jgi:hypothetical protein